jgi:CMP-N,N'-diacetyllegionaminic acid synthase
MTSSSLVALVPARAGSERVRGKNIRNLGGHPLIAYTVSAALDSGLFADVVVSTDSDETADIARHYGASVPFMRPQELATSSSPDIEWVEHALAQLGASGAAYDVFALLRPTSPLRTADTITRAWKTFDEQPSADSLRAVEPCEQHPGKMWRIDGEWLVPLMGDQPGGTPWHSRPTQSLPKVFVQNASLEIAWTRCITEQRSISGKAIVAFETHGLEGYDVNTERDFWYLERLLEQGDAQLPKVHTDPYRKAV